jgi:hypothetical protein
MSKFLFPLIEYNRIHQVVHGTIREEANVERSCTFFAVVGSLILNKHYRIAARPVAGAFLMCVEPDTNLVYGRDVGGRIEWGDDAFHMWVQTPTHIIDFMAPIYAESFAIADPSTVVPRKMFQRRIEDECRSIDDLRSPGDFITFPDPDLSKSLTDHVLNRAINRDFIEIADHWYGGRRAKQKPTMTIACNDGITRQLSLPNTIACGAW